MVLVMTGGNWRNLIHRVMSSERLVLCWTRWDEENEETEETKGRPEDKPKIYPKYQVAYTFYRSGIGYGFLPELDQNYK